MCVLVAGGQPAAPSSNTANEAASAAARDGFDCSTGCDLSGSSPVCGKDGITYLNRCLALCQGVAVASDAPCDAAHTARFDPAMIKGPQDPSPAARAKPGKQSSKAAKRAVVKAADITR